MSPAKHHPTTDYAAELLALFPAVKQPRPKPKSKVPQPPRRGAPKALGTIRHKGQFLKAIAKTKRRSCLAIAEQLHELPEYRHLSVRHLRDEVAAELDWVTKRVAGWADDLPPHILQRYFGIEPRATTASMTTEEIERENRRLKRELRQMALKILRYHLKANKA
jgi:hypothetical protein